MIYTSDSAAFKGAIDDYRTGSYGEVLFEGFGYGVNCCNCGVHIPDNERRYDVDGNIYCIDCSAEAESEILDLVRDEYIYSIAL